MPTSNLAVWPWIINHVEQVPHRTVLDVGPGYGKASVLLREYLNVKPAGIDAVEAWEPYVRDYDLVKLYDSVYVGDVTADTWELWRDSETFGPGADPGNAEHDAAAQLATYDVVLMGDVIEHIAKDRALDLLARIPQYVVICTPVAWFDNDPTGTLPPTEAHVSHWTRDDWDRIARGRAGCRVDEVLGGWVVTLGPATR